MIDLTHWSRVTHICVSKFIIIGSDNGLSPGRRQAIIWTNAGILLIGPLGTKFSEIIIAIHWFSFKEMHLKMSSGKWRPFCIGLNLLKLWFATSRVIRHSSETWYGWMLTIWNSFQIWEQTWKWHLRNGGHFCLSLDVLTCLSQV